MRQRFGRIVGWICLWVVVAILFASHQVASRSFVDGVSVSWSKALQLPILMSLFWGTVSPFVLWLIRRFPLGGRSWLKAATIHVGASTLLSLTFISICVSIISAIAANSTYTADPPAWELTWPNIFIAFARITFHSNMLIYFAILTVGQTVNFYKQMRERDRVAAKLQVDLVSTQLDQLRDQLQPHFLFNTLSAITTYVDEDPNKAKTIILRLSELLRVLVDESNSRTRRFDEELDFLRKYVDIQSVRFGDRFEFSEDVQPGLADVQIPFLILQPLVENAIKHGASETDASCEIKLTAKLADDLMKVEVADTGPGCEPDSIADGVGFGNTKSRLEHLYGDRYSFKAYRRDGQFVVSMTLPAEKETTA